MRFYVLDGGGPKDSENTLNSILTKCGEKVFWQIGADMELQCGICGKQKGSCFLFLRLENRNLDFEIIETEIYY